MTERLRVVVRGRVQGVGFRYATSRQAEALGLAGWVRNRPDGAVEAEFEGARAVLEDMLTWCGEGPAFGRVTRVEHTWEPAGATHHEGFSVRY